MKFQITDRSARCVQSPPSRGAWIEIILMMLRSCPILTSPPSRGAWIEINDSPEQAEKLRQVAPLAGGVD